MKKHKNLKPIDAEVSLIYICPSCNDQHWLFLREAKTKGFRIACGCGDILFPKLVSGIKIVYQETLKRKINIEKEIEPSRKATETSSNIREDINILTDEVLEECCKTLFHFGFSKKEAEESIKSAHMILNTTDIKTLVKYVLKQLEK